MTEQQIVAGIVHNSLFYSTSHTEKGLKYRTKIINAFKRKLNQQKNMNFDKFYAIADKANLVFKESWKEFPDGVEVVVPKIAFSMINNHDELFKPYKLNMKHVIALNAIQGEGTAFDSMRVANSLARKIYDS